MDLLNSLPDALLQPHEPQKMWSERMCVDGRMMSTDNPIGNIWSAFLTTGLNFSETLLCRGNVPYLWREHYLNITDAMRDLSITSSSFPTANELLRRIEVLCQKNHYPPYSIVKINIWQQFDTHQVHYCILQQRLHTKPYQPDSQKVILMPFSECPISVSTFSWINRPDPIFTIAQNKATEAHYQGACIFNTNNEIITTTLGNLYLISHSDVIGVQYHNGARRNTIDEYIEKVARSMKYQLRYAQNGISLTMLQNASECFVANVVDGIKPVNGYGTTIRFMRENSFKFAQKLHEMLTF